MPFVGILAPQINFFYNLIEPIVQSGLFNILDWLSGMITFSQGLSNFFAATASSINYFIQTEINWVLSFLPPLPPLPPSSRNRPVSRSGCAARAPTPAA